MTRPVYIVHWTARYPKIAGMDGRVHKTIFDTEVGAITFCALLHPTYRVIATETSEEVQS